MKLWVLSDLHRTDLFGFEPPADFDVLVVAGDVTDGDVEKSIWTVARLAAGREAIFVPGNHEFWGDAVCDVIERGRASGAKHGLHFLECDTVEIGGVKFAGCTMWEADPAAGFRSTSADPVDIGGPGVLSRRAKPADIRRLHERAVEFLTATAADVVITHHEPTPDLISRVSRIHPPHLWVFGHAHSWADLSIGPTHLVRNPAGYAGEVTGYDLQLVVEIPEPAPVLTP
jgi:Icc-related predicted phosphoesterase